MGLREKETEEDRELRRGGERGRRHTGIELNKNIDVIDVPDLEEMIESNRTQLL